MNCICQYPGMDGYFNQFTVNHVPLPQTTVTVTNDTGAPQQVVFYGGDAALHPVQPRIPSGILGPGQRTQFTFLPQSVNRLVMVMEDPNNINGYSKSCNYQGRMDPFIDVTVSDIRNCSEERHRSYGYQN